VGAKVVEVSEAVKVVVVMEVEARAEVMEVGAQAAVARVVVAQVANLVGVRLAQVMVVVVEEAMAEEVKGVRVD